MKTMRVTLTVEVDASEGPEDAETLIEDALYDYGIDYASIQAEEVTE